MGNSVRKGGVDPTAAATKAEGGQHQEREVKGTFWKDINRLGGAIPTRGTCLRIDIAIAGSIHAQQSFQ